MKLLPSNATLKEQKFALFLDEKAKENYKEIDINPLTCKKELLPFLAVGLNVDINGLEEGEVREYLFNSLSNRTKKGTVGAVEDALYIYFKKYELREWWKDERLAKGEFLSKIFVDTTNYKLLTKSRLTKCKQLIFKTKNVRSHFKGFDIDIKYEAPITTNTAFVATVELNKPNLHKDMQPIANINTGVAVIWQI